MRLDIYISQKLWVSRNRAHFFIDQKKIKVNNQIITKESYRVKETDIIDEDIDDINYVSRSALKLKWFLETENIKIDNFICLDIGSSTGGFSQILLEKQAKKIYSIDVWTSQLHESLRNNSKIISIENTDIRKIDKKIITEHLDLIVCDVSFISLHLIIDAIIWLMKIQTHTLLLFKPQFEVWIENITKMWIPKNQKIVQEKLSYFCLILRKKWVKIHLVSNSLLMWENGNQEIFIYIQK